MTDRFAFHAWPPRQTGGQHVRQGAGVLVVDLETGLAAFSEEGGSPMRNREIAQGRLLEALSVFSHDDYDQKERVIRQLVPPGQSLSTYCPFWRLDWRNSHLPQVR